MANTVYDMSSKSFGEEYKKLTIVSGDIAIFLLPKDAMLTVQLNANTTSDTCELFGSVEEYKVINASLNVSNHVLEKSIIGSKILRTVEHGATSYAISVTAGTYVARIRVLRNGAIYKG